MGVWVEDEIKDRAKFHGNISTCMFCLSPHVKVSRTYDSKGGTNYVYLNTTKIENSKLVCGLGFGGFLGEFKLFFDHENLETDSYLKPDDTTYELGFLADKQTKLLNVRNKS
jgi:hypothetical protein